MTKDTWWKRGKKETTQQNNNDKTPDQPKYTITKRTHGGKKNVSKN